MAQPRLEELPGSLTPLPSAGHLGAALPPRCNALPASADDRAIGDRVVQETLMQHFLEDRQAALWPLSLSAVTDQAAIGNLTGPIFGAALPPGF